MFLLSGLLNIDGDAWINMPSEISFSLKSKRTLYIVIFDTASPFIGLRTTTADRCPGCGRQVTLLTENFAYISSRWSLVLSSFLQVGYRQAGRFSTVFCFSGSFSAVFTDNVFMYMVPPYRHNTMVLVKAKVDADWVGNDLYNGWWRRHLPVQSHDSFCSSFACWNSTFWRSQVARVLTLSDFPEIVLPLLL